MTDGNISPRSYDIASLDAYVEKAENATDYAYARELARDLTYYSGIAANIEIDLFRAANSAPEALKQLLSRSILLARALRCTVERSLPLELNTDLALCLERAASFAYFVAQSLSLAMRNVPPFHLGAGRDSARRMSRNLEASLRLVRALTADVDASARLEWSPLAALAQQLIMLQALLLPATSRNRYMEELEAELYFLTKIHAGRFIPLIYAFRQFGRVVQLRFAVRTGISPMRRISVFLHWVLSSNLRTWSAIGPLLAFSFINVYTRQGWGSTVVALPAIAAFYAGVKWIRNRWDIETKRKSPPE
ncbi:hypothetical protein GCM10009733_107310 [Nonomuraea maheshkhaliensis]|uniref:Uncharacterized protein n=1 Tax=Nonomuraea maheshkhaliensis TaxID=419590 RepID=A0ABN2HV26_9ACTN